MYDEPFHEGLNIIHGSNGSGKSTLADFLFFGLGGELKEWKEFASLAEHVLLEIETPSGVLSLRRAVSAKATRPMSIYFGRLDMGLEAPETEWVQHPYSRPNDGFSFSQVLFKAIGLPEAISEGASNITMHQLLRVLYVDQLTPVQRIFRDENFDPWQTRQAVGDLLTGVGGYGLYECEITLRETQKKFDEASAEYKSLAAVASEYGDNILIEHIDASIRNLEAERERLLASITDLLEAQEDEDDKRMLQKMRSDAQKEFRRTRSVIGKLSSELEVLEYEIGDADDFIRHLSQSLADFDDSATTFFSLGHLAFEYCPACFAPVQDRGAGYCNLCGAEETADGEDSRTLAVRLDLEMQLKESESLQTDRHVRRSKLKSDLKSARQQHRKATSNLDMAELDAVTGRESAISDLSRAVGYADSELAVLHRRLDLSKRVRKASQAKEDLNAQIQSLKSKIEAIRRGQNSRKFKAYTAVSNSAKALLRKDLEEHSDFGDIEAVSFDFAGDWVAINGEKNRSRSASGMVILKNSFAAGLFAASLSDDRFNLPRWILFDNIEDKGMVEERSWNFQRLLVDLSKGADTPHQIIFTTSKIAPELNESDFVVGRKYTKASRSLRTG